MSVLKLCQDELQAKKVIGETSFGYVCEDGGLRSHIGAACIGPFRYSYNSSIKKACYIWNVHNAHAGYEYSEEDTRWWLSFVTGPESPWRKIIRASEPQDPEFIYKFGYVITDTHFPSNFVGNFLTAFRLCSEKPWLVRLWRRLHSEGISHGVIALVLTAIDYQAADRLKNGNHSVSYWSWHYAFDLDGMTIDSPDLVNSGEPNPTKLSKKLFHDNSDYTPCNVIWQGTRKESLQNLFIKYVVSKGKPPQASKRMFRSQNEALADRPTEISYELLRDFCKLVDSKEILKW